MKKVKYLAALAVLVCGLVIVPNNSFAQLTWADAFITPNANSLLGGLGAFVGGDVPNSYDWSIGNRCPLPIGATTKDMVFSTCESGTWKERMRITKGGNIGIGTSGPRAKLHIEQQTGDPQFFEGINIANTRTDSFTNIRIGEHFGSYETNKTVNLIYWNSGWTQGDTVRSQRRNSASLHVGKGASGGLSFVVPAGPIAFFDITGEVMDIANGNVGIGTTNPISKLHVDGYALFEVNEETAPFACSMTSHCGVNNAVSIYAKNTYHDTTQNINNEVAIMGVSLHGAGVYGEGEVGVIGRGPLAGFFDGEVVIHDDNGGKLNVFGDALIGGNVDIEGVGLYIKGTGGKCISISSSNEDVYLYLIAGGGISHYGWAAYGGQNAVGLYDYNAGSYRIHVGGNGNIGIGTTSPVGKLDVNGAIYQRGSQLHADYVFEDEYKLESIEAHAKYMWTEKHLKAIPKAEKDESGQEIVEVGAHRKGIVEELEKAHIYIEQLHKEMKRMKAELQAQISSLKKD